MKDRLVLPLLNGLLVFAAIMFGGLSQDPYFVISLTALAVYLKT